MRISPHILSIFFVAALASNSAIAGFRNGTSLNNGGLAHDRIAEGRGLSTDSDDASTFRGYILGVHDMADGLSLCTKNDTTAGQLVAIVKKYLKANPEKWGDPGEVIVLNALMPVFPCKK